MGSTRDFITATLADAIAPSFKRPVEDIIYETLDRRQTPSRTDFKELRELLQSLRAQNTGFSSGIKKIKEGLDDLEESMHNLETQVIDTQKENKMMRALIDQLMERVEKLEQMPTQPTITNKSILTNTTKTATKKQTKAITDVCKLDGCGQKVRASGFCGPHYSKWRRGTLDGVVDYEGFVELNGEKIGLKKYRGQVFSIQNDEIWIGEEKVFPNA